MGDGVFADTVENFDDGNVVLRSFPGQDMHPDSWRLDTAITYNNSPYSLRLHGNTWKTESIYPIRLDSADVWQVAAYVSYLGEIQGFGLQDSAHTLFYSLAGSEQVNPDTWVAVYQGAFPLNTWNLYLLPVGEDWLARFGYLPVVTGLVFVNDRDTDPRAVVCFDEILDITSDRPVAPRVEIWHASKEKLQVPSAKFQEPVDTPPHTLVTVQFYSRITDPDSRYHDYYWSFGDDSTSRDSWPLHTYLVRDNHEYTVLLEVRDSTGCWGRASCKVNVDPGPTTLPVRVNFTGDIMLARRYELPGGIIDTLGPRGIFKPTLPYLGDAADITVVNLESPLTAQGTRHPTKPIVFRGRPSNVAGLTYAGVDVVCLANNHVIDYGLEGMRETQDSLAANGIGYCGAGANSYEAFQPVFVQKSGLSFAFLAACDRNGQYDNYQPYLDAGLNKPGFAYFDSFHIRRQIESVRSTADIVVVLAHTGEEYASAPDSRYNDGQYSRASVQEADEWYSRFALFPAPGDTAERHRAIEAGADLVVCHHPHVLQGFEVYKGRLIAHSLGNFAFDQEYSETYPSVILAGEVDETGFRNYTLIPVFIDDYIPNRAFGRLGRHILDYLARRSRDLGTYVVVNPESTTAWVVLDTTTLVPIVYSQSGQLQLLQQSGYWTSNPLALVRIGCLSRVVSASPGRNWQFRLGRDMVWFGNFEKEGATMWLLDQAGESYDTVCYEGQRSLRQTRATGATRIVTGLEDRVVCYSDTAGYSLYAYMRTRNARLAGAAAQFYTARAGSSPIGTANLGTEINGTTGWRFYYRDFSPTTGTAYFDLELASSAPYSDTGYVWFDNVGLIEWEPWQPLTDAVRVPHPNDYYWIQLRATDTVASATLFYEETGYDRLTNVRAGPGFLPVLGLLLPGPNPSRSPTAIRYSLTKASRVNISVYNILGQKVQTLVSGLCPAGAHSLVWGGCDSSGAPACSGTYFLRLEAEGQVLSRRLVLVR